MAQGDTFHVASITSPRDPCLMTLGRPVWPSGTGTIPSRCHCIKVEKVATLKDCNILFKDSQATCTIFNMCIPGALLLTHYAKQTGRKCHRYSN